MGAIIAHHGLLLGGAGGGGGPFTDDFSTNTISSYTVNGGAWNISGGVMNHTAVSAASLTRNGVSWADGTVSSVAKEAGNNGLVARWQDNNNYYVAIVRDASSASGTPNTIQLYKRVAGTFTSLGTGTIAFTRDTLHTVDFVLLGTSLTVKFDGVTKITATDSAISAAGGVGMWGDTTPNQWDSFTWTT